MRLPPTLEPCYTTQGYAALPVGFQLLLPIRHMWWIGLWSQLPYGCGRDENCPVCRAGMHCSPTTRALDVAQAMRKEAKAKKAAQLAAVKPVAETDLVKCTLDAILAAFPQGATGDVMAPGLVLSKLPTGEYYASVARYPRWQGGKVVTFKAKAATWEAAVRDAMGQFLESAAVFERLRAAL